MTAQKVFTKEIVMNKKRETAYVLTPNDPDTWGEGLCIVDEFDNLDEAKNKYREYNNDITVPDEFYLVQVEKENIAHNIDVGSISQMLQDEWSEVYEGSTSEILQRKLTEMKEEIGKLENFTYWPIKIISCIEDQELQSKIG